MFKFIQKNKIALMFMVFVLGVTSVAIFRTINVNDFYWHVKSGEWMVEHGGVPKNGVLSWYGENLKWVAHEWLFAVIIHYIELISGNIGVYLYTAVTSAFLIFLLFWNMRKELHKVPMLMVLWFPLAILSVQMVASARPHMLMFILTGLLVNLLFYFKRNPNTKMIYFLPLIAVFWVNIHGGSSNMVYALPILMILSSLKSFRFFGITSEKLPKDKLKLLIGLTVVSTLLLVVNPNTWEMLIYPYSNMGDGLMLSFINEWRAPDAKKTMDLAVAFVPIVLQSTILSIKRKKIRVEELLFSFFFVYMAMRSIRFAYYIYLIQSLVLFRELEFTVLREHKKKIAALSMVLGLIFVGFSISQFEGTLRAEPVSAEMMEFVKEEAPERIFNDYNYGGYLIYHDIPVFIDGRADVYSRYNLSNYISFTRSRIPDVEEYLREYEFDTILIGKYNAVIHYLNNQDYAVKIHEDDKSIFYRIDYEIMNEKKNP